MGPTTNEHTLAPEATTTAPGPDGNGTLWECPPEVIPNVDELVIEDGKPVDNFYVEKQQRLLTEPLYSSWAGPGDGLPFRAASNVGLFYTAGHPLVPDAMLSLRMPGHVDLRVRENRSYFVWLVGKVPEVVVEIVSDTTGDEDTIKMRRYAEMGIPYYVIYDPQERLRQGVLRAFALREGSYQPIDPSWFPAVALGLTLWRGRFEDAEDTWLRWCDREGKVVPTGRERSEQARQEAEQERQRAERLAAQLRALGVDPSA